MTTPLASAPGLASSSSSSATTRIVSSRSSRPCWVLADTSTNSVSPPHSEGCRLSCVISVRTRVGSAPSLSTLLTATRIGTSAAFEWSTASRVCGMTPSSAATTTTAMSVDWRAAGAHGGERLVARRVEEGDRLAVVVDLVGADVLRDAAGLARGDLGLADRVQQRRLAVVDVAHDGDDRRALDEVLVVVLEDRPRPRPRRRRDDLDLLAELLGQDQDRLVGERLRERDHLAHAHELLDDLGDRRRRGTRRRP